MRYNLTFLLQKPRMGVLGFWTPLLESAGKPVSVGVLITQGAGLAQPGCQGVLQVGVVQRL